MKNQQIIQLETKINQIQAIINSYKSELANHEKTLLALAEQLVSIKNQTNKNNMKKLTNQNNAYNGEKINSN